METAASTNVSFHRKCEVAMRDARYSDLTSSLTQRKKWKQLLFSGTD